MRYTVSEMSWKFSSVHLVICWNILTFGGVAIYLREDIAVDTEPILGYSNGVVEVLGLYNKSRNLLSLGVTSVEDTKCLQNDLDAIHRWADDNNMEFNSTKFECVRYGRITELRESTHYTSKDGSPIIEVDHLKDLGVTMSRDGTFSRHIIMTTETAKQMCGWILRTFLTRETVPMLTLWKCLIRSKLEYCCQLWNPSRKGDIQMVEQVQRNFIRKITGMEQLSYWEQLHALCTLWKGDVRGT